MKPRFKWAVPVVAASLVLAACGSDEEDAAETTAAGTQAPVETEAPAPTEAPETSVAVDTTGPAETTEAPTTEAPTESSVDETTPATDAVDTTTGDTEPAAEAYSVDTADCADPDAANEPIEDSIQIGMVVPLSGGPAAAFAPLRSGFEAYIDYANENELVPGLELEVMIGDDQYNKDLTPGVVNGLLDDGVDMFVGITGTPNNLAVRDLLNEECVPQIHASTGGPQMNDAENYPWASGQTMPFNLEGRLMAARISEDFPESKVALYYVNLEYGLDYANAFTEEAEIRGLDLVSTQTIEASDVAPPTAQLSAIAREAPDAIFAVPLGGQCPTFLTELANAKAANPGWEPQLYLTSTCGFTNILSPAGDAADGLISASSYLDASNPNVVAEVPELQELQARLEAQGEIANFSLSTVGWAEAELAVEEIRRAMESEDGLTRASILNAHRNIDYQSAVMRAKAKMSGLEDDVLIESIQFIRYNAAAGLFEDDGPLLTEFESS